jgi:hypothetical protein
VVLAPNKWYQSEADIVVLEEELEMDVESVQMNVTAKVPMLKQNEFEMWRLRIEQYFQVQDYTLWEINEDGDSFKSTTTTSTIDGKEVTKLQTKP